MSAEGNLELQLIKILCIMNYRDADLPVGIHARIAHHPPEESKYLGSTVFWISVQVRFYISNIRSTIPDCWIHRHHSSSRQKLLASY